MILNCMWQCHAGIKVILYAGLIRVQPVFPMEKLTWVLTSACIRTLARLIHCENQIRSRHLRALPVHQQPFAFFLSVHCGVSQR